MIRFSHTATFETDGMEKEVRAVFTTKPATSALATLFNVKTAGTRRKPGDIDMTLEQVEQNIATSGIGPEADQLKLGRTAIIQHQRYEEQFANRVSKAFAAAVGLGRVTPAVKQSAGVSL
ncbi:MAG: hypothetical protein EPN97_11210 [Alphaproteobacteria bacterium]|nr:MAG: hypothetical protein EPN97_11210 [Alphaproteobacteria bacterium]